MRMFREICLPGAIILILVVVIRLSGLLQVQEWMAFDSLSRMCPSSHIMSSMVIVGIDEADLRLVGGYPVPDRDLAAALTILQSHHPSVIGLDLFRDVPIEPGHTALVQAFQTMPNLVGTEVALNSEPSLNVNPFPGLPSERVGFADVIVDADGKLRRSILASSTWEDDVIKYSLALRLAQMHLARHGVLFQHGDRARDPLQFGFTELPRFQSNSGGYIQADANGNQIILNFCGSQETIRTLSLRDVLQQNFPSDWVQDQVVIIGMTASSIKDIFFTSALQETLSSRTSKSPMPANQPIYGVEIHAHTVHQIVDAVLKGKPLIQSWADGWEYLWIIAWGVVGVALGIVLQSPWKTLLSLTIASLSLSLICQMLLAVGWWVPIVPALLTLCGAGLVTSFFDRDLRFELEQRRLTIERTYEAVHNGPLQYLAVILRSLGEEKLSSEQLGQQLRSLNDELRRIFEHMRQDVATRYAQLYLRGDLVLDLRSPVSELLYQVYNHTRAEQLPGFNTIRTFIPPNFEHLKSRHYSLEQKRGLCLFLHEALFNVGKHAGGATRLDVICTVEAGWYVLRVIDNGPGIDPTPSLLREGQGTLQARAIAHDLRGHFNRRPNDPQGTICDLSWRMRRNWFRWLRVTIVRNPIR